jgi:hypothetical protein
MLSVNLRVNLMIVLVGVVDGDESDSFDSFFFMGE